MTPTAYNIQDARCTFSAHGMPEGTFLVWHWRGVEAVSQPYRFDVTLACADRTLALEALAGTRATLTVRHGGKMLPWHGVITQIRQTGIQDAYALYDIVLEPRLALLRDFRRSDVFLGRTLADIVRDVLADADLVEEGGEPGAPGDFVFRADAGPALPFVCQFEESALDFISRWLEREGIAYWFEQQPDRECVVFGSDIAQRPTARVPLVWHPMQDVTPEQEDTALTAFACTVQTAPGSVVLRDFAASRADLDLTVGTVVPADGQHTRVGETSIYGEHYDTQAEGHRLATLRAEAAAAWRRQYDGTSLATPLRAGHLATLSGHFRPDFDTDYYIVHVEHTGRQPLPGESHIAAEDADQYHNRFVALAADATFRPQRRTRWPRVIGMTTAVIDAEGSGEYAEINENGCYKVRFAFASRRAAPAHNSAWIRKATPYAGSDHGMHLPLLKGTEVLISFLGGNPDRPVIAGAVANSEHPNRLNTARASQPGLRTAGGNALAFEDRAGEQSVVLGSPVHQSHLALGAADSDSSQHGVRLLSQNHMKLVSGSYEQNVPGIFRHRVIAGANSTAPYLETPSAAALTETPKEDTGKLAETPATPATPAYNVSKTWWDGYGSVTGKQGVTVTEFAGEAATLYAGSWNMVAAGLRTDLTMGLFLMLRAAQTTTLSVGTRLDYQWTGWEKKSVKEDHTAATYTGVHATKTTRVVSQTDQIGTYDLDVAGQLSITAGVATTTSAPTMRMLAAEDLILNAGSAVTIASRQVSVAGAQSASLMAPTVDVGGPATASLTLGATSISIGQADAPMTVTVGGSLVSVTATGLVRIG